MHVVVIGAGAGGLCLAHGLRRAGVSVGVYERHPTRAQGPHGHRVGVGPVGARALRACLPPEVFSTFVATCARGPRRLNVITEELALTASFPLEPAGDRPGGEYSTTRTTLRQVLLTGLEDVVHYGKVFDRYERHGDKVTAYFQDGTSTTGDLLVAADGTHSRVRRQYLPDAAVTDTGIRVISGKVPLTPETTALLPPEALDGMSLTFAAEGRFCVWHVMEHRWDRDGAVKPGVDPGAADLIRRWAGLPYDDSRDCVNWWFSAEAGVFPDDLRDLRGDELVRLVLEMTPHWHPGLRRLFRRADPAAVVPIEVRVSEPIPTWRTTNVTLLGDAVHTMPPGRGVGGDTALRDAALLTRGLAAAARGEQTPLEAVAGYEAEMAGYGFAGTDDARGRGGTACDGAVTAPYGGRVALALTRTYFRTAGTVPAPRHGHAADLHAHPGDGAFAPQPR